jgi:hypothetical protein
MRLQKQKMLTRSFKMVPALMCGLLSVAAAGNALAQGSNPACNWYVQESTKQQQENLQKGCNFRGAEWTSDVKALTTFCERNPPATWKSVVEARARQLATSCKK